MNGGWPKLVRSKLRGVRECVNGVEANAGGSHEAFLDWTDKAIEALTELRDEVSAAQQKGASHER